MEKYDIQQIDINFNATSDDETKTEVKIYKIKIPILK